MQAKHKMHTSHKARKKRYSTIVMITPLQLHRTQREFCSRTNTSVLALTKTRSAVKKIDAKNINASANLHVWIF